MSRLWVITYDIGDARRRRTLAAALEVCVERVQESVFESWFASSEIRQLMQKIAKIIKPAEDSVRLYSAGGARSSRRQSLGAMPATAPLPDFWSC